MVDIQQLVFSRLKLSIDNSARWFTEAEFHCSPNLSLVFCFMLMFKFLLYSLNCV